MKGQPGFLAAAESAASAARPGIYLPVMMNQAILDHFKSPHNTGQLLDANATVDVANPVCGDVLRLSVRLKDSRIEAARFKAQGCVAAIAASSVLTDLLTGKTVDEAGRISPEQISEALGGLPPATFHAAQLCCDAVRSLLRKL